MRTSGDGWTGPEALVGQAQRVAQAKLSHCAVGLTNLVAVCPSPVAALLCSALAIAVLSAAEDDSSTDIHRRDIRRSSRTIRRRATHTEAGTGRDTTSRRRSCSDSTTAEAGWAGWSGAQEQRAWRAWSRAEEANGEEDGADSMATAMEERGESSRREKATAARATATAAANCIPQSHTCTQRCTLDRIVTPRQLFEDGKKVFIHLSQHCSSKNDSG